MSTTEADNKELVRRYVDDVWNEGNLDLVDEYIAEDFVEHNPAVPHEAARGPADFKQNVEMMRTAFPDLTLTIEDLIAEDDEVAIRLTERGTHEGELMGIDPTGTEVEAEGIAIGRIEDGQLAEAWVQLNMMGLMQQLGVIEPPGE